MRKAVACAGRPGAKTCHSHPSGHRGHPGVAPAPAAHPMLRQEGFAPSHSSWLPPSPCPERAAGVMAARRLPSRQRGGCRCSHAAANLHVCPCQATFMSPCFPPRGRPRTWPSPMCATVSRESPPMPWRVIAGTWAMTLLPPAPRIGGPGSAGWLGSARWAGNLRLPGRVLLFLWPGGELRGAPLRR